MMLLLLLVLGAIAQDETTSFQRKFDENGNRIPLTDEEKALRKAAAQERGRGKRTPKERSDFQCQDISMQVEVSGTSDNDEACQQGVAASEDVIGYAFMEGSDPSCFLLTRDKWTQINDQQAAGDGSTKVCRLRSEAKKERSDAVDKPSVIIAIKQDIRQNHDKTIKQLASLEERKQYILSIISDFLDGDEDRENSEENRELIYAKLIKKKDDADDLTDGKKDDGFFKNLDNYTTQQVEEMREEELEKLYREKQQEFLDEVNARHSGTDFTIDGEAPNGYADAVALVRDAKSARRSALNEAKGEGKLTRQGESVKKKLSALKKAKQAAQKFDRKSKYGKWQKQHDRKGKLLDQQQEALDNDNARIGQACQRIKIDLRREGVEADNQLDEFVQRLAVRGLEDWAPAVLFRNASGIYTCGKKKIETYYNSETDKITAKKQENIDALAVAEATWSAKFTDEFETQTQAEKRELLQNAVTNAQNEYDVAVQNTADHREYLKQLVDSGLADLKPPRRQQLREKAKNKINRKQGKQRVQFTP